jgi:glycosyltransferase involved in cell wall biosynthesis
VVAYAGSFEAYQGLPLLVEAARRVFLRRPDTVFVLVGRESEKDSPNDTRAPLARGSMKIEGRQPRHAMPAYLGLADVLVSPRTQGDNIPLKIFDYLASGRPIVATDIAAHRAILNRDRAVLVEPTPEALAQGILRLLDNREEAEMLGRAGKRHADEHFTWMAFSQAVGRLHPDLVVGRGRRDRA